MKNTRCKYVTVDILDRHFFQNLHFKTLKMLLSSNVIWITGIKLQLKANTNLYYLVFTVLKGSNIVFPKRYQTF